jgi:FtsZ-interacting cell division protein YlmF
MDLNNFLFYGKEEKKRATGTEDTRSSHIENEGEEDENPQYIINISLSAFDNVVDVFKYLQRDYICVVNLKDIASNREAQRIVDYLSGTVFAMNGYMETPGEKIIVVGPDYVKTTRY